MQKIKKSYSLLDFRNNTEVYIKRLKESGNPEILTIDGKAEVIIQDVQSYQLMLERFETMESIEKIKQSLADIKANRVFSAKEVHDELRQI